MLNAGDRRVGGTESEGRGGCVCVCGGGDGG